MATSAQALRSAATSSRAVPSFLGPRLAGASTRAWQMPTRESEKRQAPRRSLSCSLSLIGGPRGSRAAPVTVPADCCNISSGGLYAIVTIGYGVAIGQRYTFQLTVGERGPEPGTRQIVSQQGEVMRAELLLGEDGYGDRIGIGVRLFGPRAGMVPMPMTA